MCFKCYSINYYDFAKTINVGAGPVAAIKEYQPQESKGNNMINKLKSQKGITGIDLTISIIIIMLFISIITLLAVNVSTSLSAKRRVDLATECMTKIMEQIDKIDYNNVEIVDTTQVSSGSTYTASSLLESVKTIVFNTTLDSKWQDYDISNYGDILNVSISAENYLPEGETEDLLKKVTVKIGYRVNKKDETIEVSRLKPKYEVEFE